MMTGLPGDRKRGTETTSISFTGGRSKATPVFSPEAARTQGKRSVLKYSSPLSQARNAIVAPASCSASSLQAAAR